MTYMFTLLLADKYENFRNMCFEKYQLDKIININNKHMKNYDKNIESSYIEYLDANDLYGWAMSQNLPINDFKWIKREELSIFN